MVNYNNGKIYKIEPINGGDDGDIYIGSTTKEYLCQRFNTHKSGYNFWKNGKTTKTTSYNLFDKYGIENCRIILLENVNANSKDKLRERESYYIKTLNCINNLIPGRTRKEFSKLYYETNKELILEKSKKEYFCDCSSILRKSDIYTNKLKNIKHL